VSDSIARVIGTTWLSRIGSVSLLSGLLLLGYSGGAYFGWFPGSYASVPAPEALSPGQRSARLAPQVVPSPATVVATIVPTPIPPAEITLIPADQADRVASAVAPRPGVPVRLVLESIGVDTEVKAGGLKPDQNGELGWETLPFVAVNYEQLGPVGLVGNPVIAGHVVTRFEGNVFRDLYKVELGTAIEVYTDRSRFEYRVDEIKLVPPESIEDLAPTPDARLTLITCGGTFDPSTRSFSDRLIVVGKLVGGARL
jgi:LPXTG-site transpeptidase (sortase) family protein